MNTKALLLLLAFVAIMPTSMIGNVNETIPNLSAKYPACKEKLNELVNQWKEDDANDIGLQNRLESAQKGYVEIAPCPAGGPPPKCEVDHWKLDPERAMDAFRAHCGKIAAKRRSQAERIIGGCEKQEVVAEQEHRAEMKREYDAEIKRIEDERKQGLKDNFDDAKEAAERRKREREANAPKDPTTMLPGKNDGERDARMRRAHEAKEKADRDYSNRLSEYEKQLTGYKPADVGNVDFSGSPPKPPPQPASTVATKPKSNVDLFIGTASKVQSVGDLSVSQIQGLTVSKSVKESIDLGGSQIKAIEKGVKVYEWGSRGAGLVFAAIETRDKYKKGERIDVPIVRGALDLGISFTPLFISVPYTFCAMIDPCSKGINSVIQESIDGVKSLGVNSLKDINYEQMADPYFMYQMRW